MGKVSTHWKPSIPIRNKRKRAMIQVQFTRKTCSDCPCCDWPTDSSHLSKTISQLKDFRSLRRYL